SRSCPDRSSRAPPTLVPYTTLFRSQAVQRPQRVDGAHVQADGIDGRVRGQFAQGRHHVALAALDQQPLRVLAPEHGGMIQRRDQDRKSTRLNSSHEWISYAVFCLKK